MHWPCLQKMYFMIREEKKKNHSLSQLQHELDVFKSADVKRGFWQPSIFFPGIEAFAEEQTGEMS